jgi:hypothetical protein
MDSDEPAVPAGESSVGGSYVSARGIVVMSAYLVVLCASLSYCLVALWPRSAPLAITSVKPDHGPAKGGTAVEIIGTGFTEGSQVFFGDADGKSVARKSDNLLSVTTPDSKAGSVSIEIDAADGQKASLAEGFTFEAEGQNSTTVRIDEDLALTLLSICVCADEASGGAGIPISNPEMPRAEQRPGTTPLGSASGFDPYQFHADKLLLPKLTGSSLCELIHPSKLRVLPKMHTPQSGLTMRAFSHHLALCMPNEVHCEWHMLPVNTQGFCLNLLLLPWPKSVRPAQFQPAPGPNPTIHHGSHEMFTLHASDFDDSDVKKLRAVLKAASEKVGRIDGVVLPELALGDGYHELVKNAVLDNDSFLISGVGSPSTKGKVGKNCVALDIPIVGLDFQTNIRQGKHHRWKLTKSQILQYGLSTHLNPAASWWEHISIAERRLVFVAMRPWLALSVLVCEDLARPDPAGDILRAVGPNLVVSILMDGPQLTDRWSARYATVLADDPGCSVLCLTSAGMAELSKPRPGGTSRSHVVALWKDPERGLIEIDLPSGADAIVLNISVDYKEEWSIDGRSDGGLTGYPILSGVHYVNATQAASKKSKQSSEKPMTALSPVEASTLSLLARHRGMSKKQYAQLLKETDLCDQARKIADELYANGRSKPKTRTSIARKTAQEIRSWADVNERIARQGPRTKYHRPIFSSDQE